MNGISVIKVSYVCFLQRQIAQVFICFTLLIDWYWELNSGTYACHADAYAAELCSWLFPRFQTILRGLRICSLLQVWPLTTSALSVASLIPAVCSHALECYLYLSQLLHLVIPLSGKNTTDIILSNIHFLCLGISLLATLCYGFYNSCFIHYKGKNIPPISKNISGS